MASDDTRRATSCGWCRGEISEAARRDSVYCSKRCRQAAHRFRQGVAFRSRAAAPMRLAYADPPYPGLARRYYEGHPDYAGEVDHRELVSRLQGFDGWALSTSARALPFVLSCCAAAGASDVRVAAWFRGARPCVSSWPLNAWEPVVFAGGRRVPSRSSTNRRDALIYRSRPRLTDPDRVVGAKPAAFAYWLFDLFGALPGDELVDLFPGSGGIARAWAVYESSSPVARLGPRSSALEPSATLPSGPASDMSPVDLVDASRLDREAA